MAVSLGAKRYLQVLSGRLKSAQRVALQGSGKRKEVGGQEREADYLSEEFVAG